MEHYFFFYNDFKNIPLVELFVRLKYVIIIIIIRGRKYVWEREEEIFVKEN